MESKYVGCLVSGYTPMLRPVRLEAVVASRSTSSRVGTANFPSYRVLPGRTSGSRSFARSVFSSSSVKSSVNQPVTSRPSITFVARRSANSGWSATSVVPLISFSCRATRTPSFVETRSGSM